MSGFTVSQGDSPVISDAPWGTDLPGAVFARLNPVGQALADTDWRIAQLYEGLLPGATAVAATFTAISSTPTAIPAAPRSIPGRTPPTSAR